MVLMKSHYQLRERLSNVLGKSSTIGPQYRFWQLGARSNLLGSTTADGSSVFLLPIQDDDKHQLFVEEAIADGKEPDSAISTASLALDRLRSTPELYLMADTPLFCRLLFDGLQSGTEHETETLGDLLYQLLTKRLTEWARKRPKGERHPPIRRGVSRRRITDEASFRSCRCP